ncbi:MAG: Rnf-Nqr domain containing protein [Oscillospiraceae bacterium]
MEQKQSNLQIFASGLLKQNPVLSLTLGICPALAVTTTLYGGLGIAAAVLVVLLCSSMVASALRGILSPGIRLPAYIIIVAGFTTLVQILVAAFLPAMAAALGVYLPLVAVSSLIISRVETFAGQQGVLASGLDAFGRGLGFAVVVVLISTLRELFGFGTLLGVAVLPAQLTPFSIFSMPAGGFLLLAACMALAAFIEAKASEPKQPKPKKEKKPKSRRAKGEDAEEGGEEA